VTAFSDLISRLEQLDVLLSNVDGKLSVNAPKDVLTVELREAIGEHRDELLAMLATPQAGAGTVEAIPRQSSRDEFPLSFSQERMWILERLQQGHGDSGSAYRISMALHFEGDLDLPVMTRVMCEILRRHEVLRTRIVARDAGAVQVVEPEAVLDVPCVDLGALPASERERGLAQAMREEAANDFDLGTGPLIRCRMYRLAPSSHVLQISMHHIAADGWTVQVMFREIAALYPAFLRGNASPLPELEVQYTDFAHWQRHTLAGEVMDRQLEYWRGQLAGHDRCRLPSPAVCAPSHGASAPRRS